MAMEGTQVMGRQGALLSQFWCFSVVGAVAFCVNAVLVEILAAVSGPVWAQLVAFPVAATVAWLLNRRYTFGASGLTLSGEWARYILANATGWLINNSTYLALVLKIPLVATYPIIAVAVGSLSGLAANYLFSRQLVFKKERS